MATRREALGIAAGTLLACAVEGAGLEAQAAFVNEEAAERVFRDVSASVVAIEDFKTEAGGSVTSEGVGSGFVWDTYGHVVTNYHCVSMMARDTTGKQVQFCRAVVLNPMHQCDAPSNGNVGAFLVCPSEPPRQLS